MTEISFSCDFVCSWTCEEEASEWKKLTENINNRLAIVNYKGEVRLVVFSHEANPTIFTNTSINYNTEFTAIKSECFLQYRDGEEFYLLSFYHRDNFSKCCEYLHELKKTLQEKELSGLEKNGVVPLEEKKLECQLPDLPELEYVPLESGADMREENGEWKNGEEKSGEKEEREGEGGEGEGGAGEDPKGKEEKGEEMMMSKRVKARVDLFRAKFEKRNSLPQFQFPNFRKMTLKADSSKSSTLSTEERSQVIERRSTISTLTHKDRANANDSSPSKIEFRNERRKSFNKNLGHFASKFSHATMRGEECEYFRVSFRTI